MKTTHRKAIIPTAPVDYDQHNEYLIAVLDEIDKYKRTALLHALKQVMQAKCKPLLDRIAELESRLAAHEQLPSQPIANTAAASAFPAIATEKRTHVDTACAAFWLSRNPQTLRAWACLENGPLRPTRISGRLAWSVAEIRKILHLA